MRAAPMPAMARDACAPGRRPLAPGIAELWYARPEGQTAAAVERQLALLGDDERGQLERLVRESSRTQFRVAHALARVALSLYREIDPASWRFTKGEHGRPEIADAPAGPRLRFNLSHTRGLVVCVVAREADVGVDVECRDARRSVEKIAARMLTGVEHADVLGRTGAARLARFLDYWTLKEAHLKAIGVGMTTSMRALELALRDDGRADVAAAPPDSLARGRWHHWRLRPTTEHYAAVAMAWPDLATLRVGRLDP